MKLYELTEAYYAIMDLDMEEQDIQTALDSLEGSVNEKAEGYAKVMRQLELEANAYDEEIKRLQAKQRTKKAKVSAMKDWLSTNLQAMQINKLETPLFKFTFRKSEAVNILAESEIPKEYIKVKTTESVDKTAIKKAIKSGEEVPGVELKVNQNLQIK